MKPWKIILGVSGFIITGFLVVGLYLLITSDFNRLPPVLRTLFVVCFVVYIVLGSFFLWADMLARRKKKR